MPEAFPSVPAPLAPVNPPIVLRRFRWWYKGRSPDGNTCSFSGVGYAKDSAEALRDVEKMMREKYPKMKWMHGKDVEREGENSGVWFGPTVQMLKSTIVQKAAEAAKGVR